MALEHVPELKELMTYLVNREGIDGTKALRLAELVQELQGAGEMVNVNEGAQSGNQLAQIVLGCFQHAFDELMHWNTLNEYRLDRVMVHVTPELLERFVQVLRAQQPGQRQRVRLAFHGTFDKYTDQILRHGFDDARIGQSDAGWYGKGHYFTPNLEYSVAYTQNRKQTVRRFNYVDAIDVGDGVNSVVVCLILTGQKKEVNRLDMAGLEGMPIDTNRYDSHEVMVDRNGELTTIAEAYASEILLPTSSRALPVAKFKITRVAKCLVWRDANPGSEENLESIRKLYQVSNMRVLVLGMGKNHLRAFTQFKSGVKYRVVTSGREGEELISYLRRDQNKNDVPALVYCMDTEKYRELRTRFVNVQVTDDPDRFFDFAIF